MPIVLYWYLKARDFFSSPLYKKAFMNKKVTNNKVSLETIWFWQLIHSPQKKSYGFPHPSIIGSPVAVLHQQQMGPWQKWRWPISNRYRPPKRCSCWLGHPTPLANSLMDARDNVDGWICFCIRGDFQNLMNERNGNNKKLKFAIRCLQFVGCRYCSIMSYLWYPRDGSQERTSLSVIP